MIRRTKLDGETNFYLFGYWLFGYAAYHLFLPYLAISIDNPKVEFRFHRMGIHNSSHWLRKVDEHNG